MHPLLNLNFPLAQRTAVEAATATSAPASAPATRAAATAANSMENGKSKMENPVVAVPASPYHFEFEKWVGYYRVDMLLSGVAVFILTLAAGWMLSRLFRAVLDRNRLTRALRLGTLALATYFMMFAWHPKLMIDAYDYGAISLHYAFFAAMLLVVLRLVDRLAIVPILTRGGKLPLPRFIHQILLIVLYLFTALSYCSWAFGLNIDKFLAGSAVISIVLGLALQETLGNFFSGMVMQASSPFQLGDWIECNGVEGRVVDMTWRAVTLLTLEDNYVLIPNAMIAKERIVNYHTPTKATARNIRIGLDYDIPPNDARRVLASAAAETEGVLPDPAPIVLLDDYADSAITYRIKFWIDNPRGHALVEHAVRTNAWYRLKQAGYSIPFPIRTIEHTSLDRKQARTRERDRQERILVLRDTPLLATLSQEQCEMLADDTRDLALAAGQILFRQNDPGDSFYILRTGTVESTINLPDGRPSPLETIAAGNFFGEESAVTGQPRPVTIRAVTDIRCLEITRQHLHALFVADPALMTKISEVVTQRQAEREAKLSDIGAKMQAATTGAQPASVLDRMKKLFGSVGKLGVTGTKPPS